MPTFITSEEVRARLNISEPTLRRRMRATPPEEQAWINLGSADHPFYRWDPEKIDGWLKWIDGRSREGT